MWPEVDALEKYLPNDGPDLTPQHLEIVDKLLSRQSEQARNEGRRLVEVLAGLKQPTFRLEFAGSDTRTANDKGGHLKVYTAAEDEEAKNCVK